MSSSMGMKISGRRPSAGELLLVTECATIQQRVLTVSLSRLRESLLATSAESSSCAASSELIGSICSELGIAARDLAAAVEERLEHERRRLDVQENGGGDGAGGSPLTQKAAVVDEGDARGADGTIVTCPAQPLLSGAKNSSCVVAAVQDLSSAFFAQEVLERERALGDARASLAALCDKLAEMSAERDETFDRLNVPPQQRDLFTALSHALEHAREEHETEMRKSSCTRVQCQLGLILAEDCSGVMKAKSSLAVAHSSPSPTSRLKPPRAGLRRRFLLNPKAAATNASSSSNSSGDELTNSSSSLCLLESQTRRLSPPTPPSPSARSPLPHGALLATHERCSRAGGTVGAGGPFAATREGLGDCDFLGDSAADGQADRREAQSQEAKRLREQRDALILRFSFMMNQYVDALGDKPVQHGCLSREVEALRRISYALHAELEDERRETVEDIARWKSEATASKQEAVSAARRAEEEAMARAIVEARLVSADTEHARVVEAIERKATTFEEKSKAIAEKNKQLQDHLDGALCELQELQAEHKAALSAKAEGSRRSEEAFLAQEAALRAELAAVKEHLADELSVRKTELRDTARASGAEVGRHIASLAEGRRDAAEAATVAASAVARCEAEKVEEEQKAHEAFGAKVLIAAQLQQKEADLCALRVDFARSKAITEKTIKELRETVEMKDQDLRTPRESLVRSKLQAVATGSSQQKRFNALLESAEERACDAELNSADCRQKTIQVLAAEASDAETTASPALTEAVSPALAAAAAAWDTERSNIADKLAEARELFGETEKQRDDALRAVTEGRDTRAESAATPSAACTVPAVQCKECRARGGRGYGGTEHPDLGTHGIVVVGDCLRECEARVGAGCGSYFRQGKQLGGSDLLHKKTTCSGDADEAEFEHPVAVPQSDSSPTESGVTRTNSVGASSEEGGLASENLVLRGPAEHETEGLRARLTNVEASKGDLEIERGREKKALTALSAEIADLSRSYSLAESRASEALTISNVKLDTALAALDDCRAALAERSRELCKHHEARAARGESCTAARVAAAADVIRSAEALATALQESQELRGRLLEEESLRRRANAELDEVMLRCKEEVAKRVATEATAGAASEEAKARYETDLAVADDERCMLEEERKLLQDRINVMENEKREGEAALRMLEQANEEHVTTIRRLKHAAASHRGQLMDSESAFRKELEQRLAEAEGTIAVATAELNAERQRAAEQKQEAAENLDNTTASILDELQQTKEARDAEVAAVEARWSDKFEAVLAELMGVKNELAVAVEASAFREGEVAALQTRLRSAEQDSKIARREVLLEGRARLASEAADAGKMVAALRVEVEVLQQRCENQERTIGALATSREEEAEACHLARAALTKERQAAAEAAIRARELELKVNRLSAVFTRETRSNTQPTGRNLNCGADYRFGADLRHPLAPCSRADSPVRQEARPNRIPQQQLNWRYMYANGMSEAVPTTMWTSWDGIAPATAECGRRTVSADDGIKTAMRGARESHEREKTRAVLSTLEESARSSRDEAEILSKRVARLREELRKAERRADEMEAMAAAGRASALASAQVTAAAKVETEMATLDRHKAEEKARAAERREEERAVALAMEIERVRGIAEAARERLTNAEEEALRLRRELGSSDKRAAVLEEEVAKVAADLRSAEAGRARLQIELLRRLGERGTEGRLRRDAKDSLTRRLMTLTEENIALRLVPAAQGTASVSLNRLSPAMVKSFTIPMSPTLKGHQPDLEGHVTADNHQGGGGDVATLRERLSNCETHHMQLVAAAEEAVNLCNRRYDARVRVAVASGTLAFAYCRWRGIEAGRDEILEAASRMELFRRCFGALRVEALRSSRDRVSRQHDRVRRWVKEAVEGAREEFALRQSGSPTS